MPDVLSRLYARIPFGMRADLVTMERACAKLGHPERDVPVVHVAGTNGKGSVCAMVESIARTQGYKTGLYTSPHLCRFAERIRLDGEPIADLALAARLDEALAAEGELSFFETATVAAFLAFREAAVDIAVIEVGLGGRFDATNVVPAPRAAAITRIALDHTDRLGTTLASIAREKAGIAKPGLDLVLGPMPAEVREVIDQVARARGATTSTIDGVPLPGPLGLAGRHQVDNARIAAALGARLGASPEAIARGLAHTQWPGRLERVGSVLLDAAHNPDGAEALARHVRSLGIPSHDVALVFGALADKDWGATLDILAPLASLRFYVAPETRAGARGAADPSAMRARHPGVVLAALPEALGRASDFGRGRNSALVLVAGSIGLVGEARAALLGLARDPPVAL